MKKFTPRESKSFHFRIELHSDLIQSFIGYMSLFKRYCRITKNRKVYFDINQDDREIVIELGISDECDLKLARLYFNEYINFLSNKDSLLRIGELTEGLIDQDELHLLKMRLIEQRKHFLIVFRLEFGLRNIIEFSESNFLNQVDFEEIDRIKDSYELEIKNYQTLIELVKSQEKNKALLSENSNLKEQVVKIEKEKEVLLHQIVNVINDKILNAEKVIEGKPDKEKLEQLVAGNRIKEVFSVLKLTNKVELKKQTILLQNQWNELQKNLRLGMWNVQESTTENSRITLAVLEVIEKL